MSPAGPVIFFYVQHLRGVGHAVRASRIARALAAAGADVRLAWGGTRLPGIDLSGMTVEWLPAVKSPDDNYDSLVDGEGRVVGKAALAARRDALLAFFARAEPDIFLTETWPFGRRQMRFELEPLTRAAAALTRRPLMVASVRDILQEGRKPKSLSESFAWFHDCYDLLLVHGDPELIRIAATLPGANAIADRVRYTGLVAPPPPDMSRPPSHRADVVVAAGGGAFGQAITQAALAAMPLSRNYPSDWLVIAGSERSETEFQALHDSAPAGMRVVRHVEDLARVFADAKICVTLAGYNTVCDLLRVHARAVVVSHSGGHETEQRRRAALLADRGLAIALPDTELNPQSLAAAVDAAADLPASSIAIDLDGAPNTARVLLGEWRGRVAAPHRGPRA